MNFKFDADADSGDILSQREVAIDKADDAAALYDAEACRPRLKGIAGRPAFLT